MKNKIITFFTLIVVTGLFFLPSSQQNKNELVFWTLQLGTFDKYINGIISDFEKQNPDVKIKWVDIPYSEGEKRTLAALLSDNPPDLINLTPDFSAMAAQKKALFEIPKSAMEAFPESMYPSLSYNGKFFAIPFYLTSAITFVNSDLLQKSGIYSLPRTYDDMFSYAENIKNKTGEFVFMPTVSENDTFWKVLDKYDVDIFSDINSDVSRKIFENYKFLYQNSLIPKESITQSHRDALEKYMAGQLVFLQAGANFLNIVKENAPSVYENTVLDNQLVGTSGKYDCSMMNLIIPLKAKNKDAALKFVLFLTNKDNQLEFSKMTSVLPANKYALESEYFYQTATKEDLARKISASQIKNLSDGSKTYRNKKNIILLLNTTVAQIMTGKSEVKESLIKLEKNLADFKE